MPLSKVTVKLPFFDIASAEWTPNTKERDAAWALYVEFSTRITSVKRELGPDKDFGSARLAMDSLYALLNATREVLREAGPTIAKGRTSLGPITIHVLNRSIRRILDDFHTKLEAHDSDRDLSEDRVKHERKWPLYERFWERMIEMQNGLQEYTKALETIAGVQPFSDNA